MSNNGKRGGLPEINNWHCLTRLIVSRCGAWFYARLSRPDRPNAFSASERAFFILQISAQSTRRISLLPLLLCDRPARLILPCRGRESRRALVLPEFDLAVAVAST